MKKQQGGKSGRGCKRVTGAVVTKRRKEYRREVAAFKKMVMGLDFEDFKKIIVENMSALEDETVKTFKQTADQQGALVGALGKVHKQIWKDLEVVGKNIKTLDDKLVTLSGFTAMLAIKSKENWQHSPMSLKERRALAEVLSIKWGEKEERALGNARKAGTPKKNNL